MPLLDLPSQGHASDRNAQYGHAHLNNYASYYEYNWHF